MAVLLCRSFFTGKHQSTAGNMKRKSLSEFEYGKLVSAGATHRKKEA
jgi:hypothetical protein